MRIAFLCLLVALVGCRKNDEFVENNYQYVTIPQLSINQFPAMNGELHWDSNWNDPFDPDIYFVVKNQEGFVYHVSNVQYNVDVTGLPLSYNWVNLNPLPLYRDLLVIEVYDSDGGDNDQLLGEISVYPFDIPAENGLALIRLTEGEISIAATLQFQE